MWNTFPWVRVQGVSFFKQDFSRDGAKLNVRLTKNMFEIYIFRSELSRQIFPMWQWTLVSTEVWVTAHSFVSTAVDTA